VAGEEYVLVGWDVLVDGAGCVGEDGGADEIVDADEASWPTDAGAVA
jgi:hypothetical protein